MEIDKAIDYAKTLIGTPYRWIKQGEKMKGDDKLWASNDEAPSSTIIKNNNKCIVCSGLINLVRRHLHLTIPGVKEGHKFAGDTGHWFRYLRKHKRLEELDVKRNYPKGTLVLRNYKSTQSDQGHLAIVSNNVKSPKTILDQNIIHSAPSEFSYNESNENDNVGETVEEKFKISHFDWESEGYYTHICLPENWLLKN